MYNKILSTFIMELGKDFGFRYALIPEILLI